ncbi:hypothetical protein EYW47_01095 [Paraburkholderia silviterrae]|uniref:Uncharacterized protein n=2 Tax=Paraburkholderia silviterrae TaxID=2528715 RepID=A0A4R5MGU2_9BURK|nr:hypothetical protein EYW47_01095 [Paraburkholderia silviterrae]
MLYSSWRFAMKTVRIVSGPAAPLRIGYSAWPGRVARQVAIDKGGFKEAGLDVRFGYPSLTSVLK